MSKILGVGIATLDIINSVERYPAADDETRALSQCQVRGGNVTNTLVVLAQAGHDGFWAGTIAADSDSQTIRNDLDRFNVRQDYVQEYLNGRTPVSYITLSKENAARSIIHFRDLPEYSFDQFCCINLSEFDWLHFEGRNVQECLKMLARVRAMKKSVPVSIEVEKHRPDIERLFEYADLLLFSKSYVKQSGYEDAAEFLLKLHIQYPRTEITCAWGEQGAFAIDSSGVVERYQQKQLNNAVDSVGAGDTFNAVMIHTGLQQLTMPVRLRKSCEVAANKCMQTGFDDLLESD